MSMFGDPGANAPVWSKYAVLLGGLTAETPEGPEAFTFNGGGVSNAWDGVGALGDDTPFDDGSEAITTADHTAAGFGVYAVTYKNQRETVVFTAKETTLVTLGIIHDISGVTASAGAISGVLKQRDPTKKYKVAFHRENGTQCERRISRNYATIDSITRGFSNDESTRTVTMLIVPTSTNELYDYYLGPKA